MTDQVGTSSLVRKVCLICGEDPVWLCYRLSVGGGRGTRGLVHKTEVERQCERWLDNHR